MASKTDYLGRIHIASACRANWETMSGSDKVRYCAECDRHVHDLSKMTRSQAERLITIKEGSFCARISRGADGTVITLKEPGPQFITRRALPLAAAVVSATISVTSTVPARAAGFNRQAQVTSVASDKSSQSSKPETPFKPIILEPADPSVLDVPIGIPVVQGLVAIRPSTLHALYDKSDLIIVGQAESSAPISAAEGGHVVTRYQMSSMLKGKSRKQRISVIHYQLIDERFADGTTALLFLSKGSAVNGGPRGTYFLAEPGAGIKVLPLAAMDSYVARIQDLGTIEQREHNLADIVEWLVQCAEDPATRWEGASELADGPMADAAAFFVSGQSSERHPLSIKNVISFHEPVLGHLSARDIDPLGQARPEQSQSEPRSSVIAAGGSLQPGPLQPGDDVPLNIISLQMREGIDHQSGDESDLASMLTAEQRERLVTALLASQTIDRGELKLIDLIETWNDRRLVEFLLARLHEMEDNPTEFADALVQHLSDSFEACEVSALADRFKDLPSDEDVSHHSGEAQNEEEQIGQEHDEVSVKASRVDKAKEAGRKRSVALKEFLAAVESRVRPKDSIVH